MEEPVLTVAQMRALDEYVINRDDAGTKLMGRAGEALADELANFQNIAVVCGSGNNGGDGYAAVYALQKRNLLDEKQVTIFYTKEPRSEESKFFLTSITHENVNIIEYEKGCLDSTFDVIVDCLLGTGFSGEPRGTIKEAIEEINNAGKPMAATNAKNNVSPASAMAAMNFTNGNCAESRMAAMNVPVISMDINSGVNGDTGDGTIAVKSDLTLSVGYMKTGMLKPCFKKWESR